MGFLQVYSPYRFGCPTCGRQWDTQGHSRTSMSARRGKSNATGFIRSGASTHVFNCGERTPAERREVNRRDEARWQRTPPTSCRVWNTPSHPGLTLAPTPSRPTDVSDEGPGRNNEDHLK